MSQLIPEEIEHLDFDPEKNDQDNTDPLLEHHKHPTANGYSWCGIKRGSDNGFMARNGKKAVNIYSCPRCQALREAFNYWELHNKHFGSNCTAANGIIYHDCGQ